MSAPVLVTGGTGTLGRKVVPRLLAAGREVRVLSRRERSGPAPELGEGRPVPRWFVGDLRSGAGLAAALDGVETVLHCATGPRGDAEAAAHLQIAARRAGSPHIVYPSIVGVDRIEYRYYRDKRAVERLLEEGDVPWTVLRTTQFHELIDHLLRRLSRPPFLFVPAATEFQPIAADEVAERLVYLSIGTPINRAPDLGGPAVLTAADLAWAWLAATGRRRWMVRMKLPGKVFAGYRTGAHLASGGTVGSQTFTQYLAETYAERPAARTAPEEEVPKAEVPKAEVPKAEVPKAEVPRVEVPSEGEPEEERTTKRQPNGAGASSPDRVEDAAEQQR